MRQAVERRVERHKAKPLGPDRYERMLGWGAVVLLGFVVAAVVRGRTDWAQVPPALWAHLATIAVALALTPVMLLRPRGDRVHRRLGWIWIAAMLSTAVISLFLRLVNDGGFSVIHLLSIWVIVQVPLIAWSARHHRVDAHRGAVRGMVTGALLIAGFFTFPFNRLLGHWLFG